MKSEMEKALKEYSKEWLNSYPVGSLFRSAPFKYVVDGHRGAFEAGYKAGQRTLMNAKDANEFEKFTRFDERRKTAEEIFRKLDNRFCGSCLADNGCVQLFYRDFNELKKKYLGKEVLK